MIPLPLSQRRLMALFAVPMMVFFLARAVFIMGLPFFPNSMSMPRSSEAFLPAVKIAAKPTAPVPAKPVMATRIVRVNNELQLNSTFREYRTLFAGQVTCGDSPCEAELRLVITSDNIPELRQVFRTDADGRYAQPVILKEKPGRAADWKIMVYTPRTYPMELNGRQILTEESQIDVQRDIQLP